MQNTIKKTNCIIVYAVNFDKGVYSEQQVIKAFSDSEDLDLNTTAQFNAAKFIFQTAYLHEYRENPHKKDKFSLTSSRIREIKKYLHNKYKTLSQEDITATLKLIRSIEVYLTFESNTLFIIEWW